MLKKLVVSALAFIAMSAYANDTPYTFGSTLTLESISNLQGGIQKGTRSLGNLDVTLAVDTQAAGWWEDGSWYLYALGDYGRSPSAQLTGDFQNITNISAPNAAKIFEFWYKHHFANDAVQLLVGLHNYNSTFYTLDSAGLFSTASFGIGPDTSQTGPSIFPTTAATILLKMQQDSFYAQIAAYDGIPGDPQHPRGTHIEFNRDDGLFNAGEFGVVEEKNYKVGFGGWQHTAHLVNPITGGPMKKIMAIM